MSTRDQYGLKIVLPRISTGELWDELKAEFAGKDRQRWLSLAVFALHHQANWSLEQIAYTFGYSAGHLSRLNLQTRIDLEQFVRERIVDDSSEEEE